MNIMALPLRLFGFGVLGWCPSPLLLKLQLVLGLGVFWWLVKLNQNDKKYWDDNAVYLLAGFSKQLLISQLAHPDSCCRLRAQQSVLGGWSPACPLQTSHPHHCKPTMWHQDRWAKELFLPKQKWSEILICPQISSQRETLPWPSTRDCISQSSPVYVVVSMSLWEERWCCGNCRLFQKLLDKGSGVLDGTFDKQTKSWVSRCALVFFIIVVVSGFSATESVHCTFGVLKTRSSTIFMGPGSIPFGMVMRTLALKR